MQTAARPIVNTLREWIQPFRTFADTRWNTPWGVAWPVTTFGIVLITYAVLEQMAPGLYANPPDFLLPILPVWADFTFAFSCVVAVAVVGPVLIYRHRWFLHSATTGQTSANVVSLVPGGFGLGVVVGSVFLFLVWYFTDGEAGREGTTSSRWDEVGYLLFGAFVTAVAAPLLEEVLFRVLLYGAIRRWARARTAILLTSALFAIAHGLQPESLSALILGLVTSTVYERTRCFAFCMAMHSGSNLAVLLLRLWLYRYGGLQ